MTHTTPIQHINYESTKMETPHIKATSLREVQVNYLLDKLQEESAECIQAVSKIRRFGPDNKHPERTTTNLQELVNELEDLLACIGVLETLGYIDLTKSRDVINHKAKQLLS